MLRPQELARAPRKGPPPPPEVRGHSAQSCSTSRPSPSQSREASLWNAAPLRVAAPSELATIVPGLPAASHLGQFMGSRTISRVQFPALVPIGPKVLYNLLIAPRKGAGPPGTAEALVARHLAPRWGQAGTPRSRHLEPQPSRATGHTGSFLLHRVFFRLLRCEKGVIKTPFQNCCEH